MKACKKMLITLALRGLLVAALTGVALLAVAQQSDVPQVRNPADASEPVISELPDSPGVSAAAVSGVTDSGSDASRQPWELARAVLQASPQSQTPTSNQAHSQTPAAQGQKPVGTAASEAPNATGIAASQPAGVAIAPAKQRRVRSIVIKTGALIGAGVAVGSVIALTGATSSKPPGAH